MDAEAYITEHWIKRKIWRNLAKEKHQERFRMICSFLEGKIFIDVGCACGHSMIHMRKFYPGHWSGMDFSSRAIDEARKLFPKHEFYYSDNFDLLKATEKKTFDSVVCSEVIEHVEKDQELFDGLLSITKKVLVITTPNRRVGDPGHLRIYTRDMLDDLVKSSSLEPEGLSIPRVKIISHERFFYMTIHK